QPAQQPVPSGPEGYILDLQRNVGNRAVSRFLQSNAGSKAHAVAAAPPIVSEALRSPSQPLSVDARALMKLRSSHNPNHADYSKTDAGRDATDRYEQEAGLAANAMPMRPESSFPAESTRFGEVRHSEPHAWFDEVRIHTGEYATKAAQSLHASAF